MQSTEYIVKIEIPDVMAEATVPPHTNGAAETRTFDDSLTDDSFFKVPAAVPHGATYSLG